MSRQLIFVDIETNGLDPRVHDAWEVAWWNLTTGKRGLFLPWIADLGKFLVNGAGQNMAALRKSRFVDRWTIDYLNAVGYGQEETKLALPELSEQIWPRPAPMTPWPDGYPAPDPDASRAVMISAQPKFDLPFLSKLFDRVPMEREPWFYRAIDLGSYALSKLDRPEDDPPSAATVAKWCGVAPGDHTAWNDVTSGGRSFLLLREFGRLRRAGVEPNWDQFRAQFGDDRDQNRIDQLIQGVVIAK